MLLIETKINDLGWPRMAETHPRVKKLFYGGQEKNLNEDRPILSAAKCRSMILVSRNIRSVRIFAWVPKKGGAEWQCGSQNRDAHTFPSKFPTLKPTLLYSNTQSLFGFFSDPKMRDREWPLNVIQGTVPFWLFQWSQNAWPWMTSKCDSRCFVLALALDASALTRLPCLAYINIPLSTYCEIRYVSKFTAASRGYPCDSTAFLFYFWTPHFSILTPHFG